MYVLKNQSPQFLPDALKIFLTFQIVTLFFAMLCMILKNFTFKGLYQSPFASFINKYLVTGSNY